MARRARIVIPGLPHYIQQNGWNDQSIFFDKNDGLIYRQILQKRAAAAGLMILSYCFMPSEIHLLAVPLKKTSLRQSIGDAHRQYARHVNARDEEKDTPLWADRFHSFPMQEKYIHHVLHLIEWIPVFAGEVTHPHQWHYSSARARKINQMDDLISDHPFLSLVDWNKIENKKPSYLQMDLIYSHQSTGRPLGDKKFIEHLETKLGKRLRPRKRGRRPQSLSLKNALSSVAQS